MILSLVQAPADLPVTLAEAKLHSHIDSTLEDADITAKLAAATTDRQTFTRRQFVTATWELWLPSWPCSTLENPGGVINVPKVPLLAVTSIKYYDQDGSLQTWSAAEYQVIAPAGPSAQHGFIVPAYGNSWPAIRSQPKAIQILFTAGYGAPAAVPEIFKQAIKLVFGEMYAFREEQTVGTIVSKNLRAADALCWPYRAFIPESR